ncbi:ParB N-terminal domain-containing protein [Chromohalobacter sp. 48-RD10]|uniref:ParB N-terminal domain-containing protein n=1 Tax=Chromohalobacter sp. 48-RD10 TaxID=2994063 RepID=UPI0024692DE6|nr:ParB N-terminal domain-containing protein [Chromohalobacter sp. 48-RD10]
MHSDSLKLPHKIVGEENILHLDYSVEYEPPGTLLPTERHDTLRVEKLIDRVKKMGVWTTPILVDQNSLAIMDGHHRTAVALKLNVKKVPVVKLSYGDPRVLLSGWESGEIFSPEDIVAAALSGVLLPLKSTKHDLAVPLPSLKIPLSDLFY